MQTRITITLAIALGVMFIANGAYMLTAPESWYWAVPGVADRGGFNQHFVRDIGIIYGLTGAAFIAGALLPVQRALLWASAAVWHIGHALFHVWEVAAGICGPGVLVQDFAGVSAPSILAAGLAALAWRARRLPA